MHRLVKQIWISDVAIAKHCRRFGIPLPPRGYWNKLHAGKKVIKAQLRPRDLTTINEVEMPGELSPELLARISTRSPVDYPIYLTRADINAAAMAVPGSSRILKKIPRQNFK
jgi:hypothetical protein